MPGYIERARVLEQSHTDCAACRCPRWRFIAKCIAIFGLLLPTAHAQTRTTFDIDAGPASQSLNQYAQQARVQLGFSVDLVGDIRTNPVKGEYETTEALDLLLAGTGLAAEHGDKGIIIHQAAALEAKNDEEAPPKAVGLRFNHGTAQAAPDRSTTSATRRSAGSGKLEEIVVTGTQIRDTGAAGVNVITLDRDYIELTGLPTTQQILQSIPHNFGGGANEATQTVGVGPVTGNRAFSSSINLRGLGTESTLLLVNGRRSASGGAAGNFVDLNSVPAAAIERVEVLPDGASAIYGSDAIGGVVNVILRNDYEGAETRLRYAPGSSDIGELQFNQVIGKRWNSGNVLFTYEYYDRDELRSEDRAYTRDSDLTNFGGEDHSRPFSNPGNIVRYTLADGTQQAVLFPIPGGQDGTALTPADLVSGPPNLQNIREGTTILPSQARNTVSVLLSQALSSKMELFGDIRYSSREYENRNNLLATTRIDVPNSNPFFVDPVGNATDLRIEYSFVDDYGPERSVGTVDTIGSTLGGIFGVSQSWLLEAYVSYNTERQDGRDDHTVNTALLSAALADPNPDTAFNPFGDGSSTNPMTLAAIEGYSTARRESELSVLNISADGDLFEISGGAAKLAIGAQFRDESLLQNQVNFTSTLVPVASISDYDLDRDVTAAFAEIYLPLVSDKNSMSGIKSLIVSLAGRVEDYSDFGDTVNPKLGLSWSPVESLTFRSTVGTSFRAPLLTELDDSVRLFQTFADVPDPASPTGETTVVFRFGNSPGLKPEEGTTWTVGFNVEPASVPELHIGLTYFATEIDNLIQVPTQSFVQPLLDPESFAPIIARVPEDVDVATVAAILNEPFCFGCFLFTADEVGAIIDFRLNNLNKSELSGVDFDVSYELDSAAGMFNLSLYASHLFHFKEQAFAGGPLEDQVDTFTKPNSLKLRSTLTWTAGGMHAAIIGNHIGDYTSTSGLSCQAAAAGFCDVGSWTTWDLSVGYDLSEFSSIVEGTSFSLSVLNVLNEDPPFVQVAGIGVGFDPFNANPLGRFVALELKKEW